VTIGFLNIQTTTLLRWESESPETSSSLSIPWLDSSGERVNFTLAWSQCLKLLKLTSKSKLLVS